jgi:hypothetical protein
MAFESLKDEKIIELLQCPKRLTNSMARNKSKEGHNQVNYKVVSTDGSDEKFEVYKRQNSREGMEDDFSCGISWIAPNGENLTLKRYNGPSHDHSNHLESIRVGLTCHIHIATEKYINANRKAEGYAEATDRYKTLDGALHCLVTDCHIIGIQTNPDNLNQTNLFKE